MSDDPFTPEERAKATLELTKGAKLLKELNIDREYDEESFGFCDSLMHTCSLVLTADHPTSVAVANESGLFHARQKNFGHASFLLYSTIKFWQKNPDRICEETVNTYIYLGIAYTIDPAFALGKEIFRNANLALERIGAEKSEKAAEVLCFEAELYMTQDDWDRALELLQQSLDMLGELGIEKTYFKGECLWNIAKIYRYRKQIRDALTYYQMAVDAYFAYFEPGHSIIKPVIEEWRNCLETFKEDKNSEILIFDSDNN